MQKAVAGLVAAALAVVGFSGGCTFSKGWRGLGDFGLHLPRPDDSSAGVAKSSDAASKADPTSLASKAKPSPDLYVAMARLAEQSGKMAEAEQHYQKALRLDAKHADALIGYARLKDRQGQFAAAAGLYERAIKAQPNSAPLLNDFGLCLARQQKLDDSIRVLEQAIKLDPQKWLYRNNIAMVLVEKGDVGAALSHLRAVQDEAVAHYNVGYILQKKGDTQAAARHFAIALEKNPSLAEARVWLNKLEAQPGAIGDAAPQLAAQRTFDAGPRVLPGELPPLPPRPFEAAARPVEAAARAVYSNVAPLPPPTSVGQAPSPAPTATPNPGGVPVVRPLPPTGS